MTEIGKRGRRMKAQRAIKKRRQEEIQVEASAADLVEKEGKEAWSKFRACCNQMRTGAGVINGDFVQFQGIEDRWLHDQKYCRLQISNGYCTNK